MPVASPAELWRETGRWDFYGKELLRFKDRHGARFLPGPTTRKVITDPLPPRSPFLSADALNFYQIRQSSVTKSARVSD